MKEYLAIGLMSGTSLDGLDMVYVKFKFSLGKWSFNILDARTLDYKNDLDHWYEKLKGAYKVAPESLGSLNIEYAKFLGRCTLSFLGDRPADLVGSHGHTIHHQPQNGLTYQLGNHQALADTIGITTIGNFRVQDVALGGQGAPLVPIGDQLLFPDYTYSLNLGGFSNLSFAQNGIRIAYDISPCNMLLNQIAELTGQTYDEDGTLAEKGSVVPWLLEKWNGIKHYGQPYPKSLGREWYEVHFESTIASSEINPSDLMATAVEHITIQIGKELKVGDCLVTGGGAKNSYLIKRLEEHSNANITIPSEELIDFKEALIFAFLAVLRVENKINVLASVTGAKHDHCSGEVYQPATPFI